MQVFVSNREIAEIADGVVRQFSDCSPPSMVNIDAIAQHIGLTVVYESLAEKEPDKIAFLSDGIRPLAVYRNKQPVKIIFPKDTVVLDKFLQNPDQETHRRFSLAHEVAHKLIYLADPLLQTACFDAPLDYERKYTFQELKERMTLNESQANTMAAALLMPRFLVTAALERYHHGKAIPIYGESVFLPKTKAILLKMTEMLGVSYSALLIQLRKYDLLDRHDLSEYIVKHVAGGGDKL